MIPLTKAFGEIDDLAARTPPGMAHFPGTGPKGRTCRECEHYSNEGRYIAGSPTHAKGELKLGRCKKYRRMMGNRYSGLTFRHNTPSCKYFSEAENIPSIIER